MFGNFKIVLCVTGLVLFGCERQKDEGPAFVVVDGHPITAAFVRDTVRISARLSELAHHPIGRKDFPAWGNRLAMRITPSLLSTYLLEREMRRIGLVPAEEDRRKVLATYNRLADTNLNSVAELAPLFGDLAEFFTAQFERDCLLAAYRRTQVDSSIGADDLERYYWARTNALVRAEKIDSEARRKADEAWKKLNAGAAWDDVAKEYSEDALLDEENAEFYKDCGTFRPQDFANDIMGKILPGMKPGEYSKPVESDEGLIIVRVNETNEDAYACGRILLRMAEPVEVLEPEAARKELSRQKSIDSQLQLLDELKEQARIEYPLGTNFIYRIWEVPKKSAAKKGPSKKKVPTTKKKIPKKGVPK